MLWKELDEKRVLVSLKNIESEAKVEYKNLQVYIYFENSALKSQYQYGYTINQDRSTGTTLLHLIKVLSEEPSKPKKEGIHVITTDSSDQGIELKFRKQNRVSLNIE